MYNNKAISILNSRRTYLPPIENIKCFYHNDNDGRLAAYFVYLYTRNKNESNYIEVDYNKVTPSVDYVNDGDIVFIVDTSFTEKTYDKLKEISNKAKKVYWFDHHKSSKELIDSNIILSDNIIKVIDMNRCGALITFNGLFAGEEIPTILKLVDDYDRWVHNYKESKFFAVATDGISLDNKKDWSLLELDLYNLISRGQVISEYLDTKNTEDFNKSGYSCIINGHRCLVMNKPGNSSVFGKKFDEVNFGIMWYYDNGTYKYSVYSQLDEIDCSKIARYFNPTGGGHKGAAGWVSKELCILPNSIFDIDM